MREIVKPETQYGDLVGQIQIDGHEGPILQQIFGSATGLPKGYFPVGVELYAQHFDTVLTNGDCTLFASVLAIDLDQSAGAPTFEEYVTHARENKTEIPVFKFDIEITAAELVAMIKRVSVVLKDRALSDLDLVVMKDR